MKWVAKRTREIGKLGYHPVLHFDLYGWIGLEIACRRKRLSILSRGLQMTSRVTSFTSNPQQILAYGSSA
ncbi:hypothetical protein AAE026_31525 [Bradyrhizobium sp. DN5]|uniref:hypothetical protein n=1 Tax=Bradyrhizobium sp. DN5 TaxID=3056950 RepID=UPI00352440AE